jgi:hypothetical protein
MNRKIMILGIAVAAVLVVALAPVVSTVQAQGAGIVASANGAGQAQECTKASYKGDFGFTATGTIVGLGQVAFVGRYTADGKGNLVGTQTASLNGTIERNSFTGTYVVKSDCTGSSIWNYPNFTQHLDFVIVGHGSKIRSISTDPGTIVTEVDEKQRVSMED